MAFVNANRTRETTTVTGLGAATLLGAVGGCRSFAAGVGANNLCWYTIQDQADPSTGILGPNWEIGYGTLDVTGTVLTRTFVQDSSNSGSAVNFTAGTKDVFIDLPASAIVVDLALYNLRVGVSAGSGITTGTNNLVVTDGTACVLRAGAAGNVILTTSGSCGILSGANTFIANAICGSNILDNATTA